MLGEIFKKIEKTNQQRATMAMVLITIMKQSEQASLSLRTSIAASFIDMLDKSMIEEDDALIKHLNDAIKSVSEEAKEYGHDDLVGTLKRIRKQVKEKMERVEEGESILKSMNLDNFNLN